MRLFSKLLGPKTITTPLRSFKGHEQGITAVAVFPDKRRMVTGSYDTTPCLWDLKTGVVLKKMEGHRNGVSELAVSRDGQLIASGDSLIGEVIVWHGETGELLTKIEAHSNFITSLNFSPDGTVLATGSFRGTMTKLWNTKTWQLQGDIPIECNGFVKCIRYSPSGEFLAIATNDYIIEIYNSGTRKRVRSLKDQESSNSSLAWTPDGTRLLTGGNYQDPTIREWDTTTWKQVGDPWTGHTDYINSIVIHPAGTLVASASSDKRVRLWQLSDRRTIAVFKHSHANRCVTFSVDGNHIFSGGYDKMISEWTVPQGIHPKTIATTTVRDTRIDRDLSTDEELLMQDINTDANNHIPYVRRSKASKLDDAPEAQIRDLAVKSYQHMMTSSDENTKADCLDWSDDFKQECSALCAANGEAAFAASDYDEAIDLYSMAIDLDSASYIFFANRSEAKLCKMLWEDALLDAQKVTKLNPSSHVGYQLSHSALRGAQRYDEAIEAFTIMLSKLDNAPEVQIRDLRRQYVRPSEAEDAIRRAVWIELSNAPLRLLNTSTGLLCDRAAQLNFFKTSPQYKELLSSITKRSDLGMTRIKDVVAMHFRCVLLSHRWEETEVLLHDIQNTDVRELKGLGGITKLQSFCKIASDAGYLWVWMDTCCIDKTNNAELGESVQSMFVWYRHSALTIVYLSDVPPSSQSGALASSVWNERGWTFQEFVAPKVVIFYQNDWSLYRNDRTPNHKESPAIMKELEDATGIDAQALISFNPGMRDPRQKLQWASKRVTTVQEDTAYSLFGIFDVHLPVIYGERKQSALGRLLQDLVSRSGDITCLDWVGQSSEFNSCLPADIISYATPPYSLLSLSEDEIQTAVSSLRNIVPVDSASKLYNLLKNMNAPLFANCRLRLPCIAFPVTEVKRKRGRTAHFTYGVKADGLRDLLITTDETLIQFSRTRPTQQTFFLVRPWDRRLLGLPDFSEQPTFADEGESVGDWSESESGSDDTDERSSNSPGEEELSVDSDLHSRSLRLMVHLGQAFNALLVAEQRVGEYKRVASDQYIIAQVKHPASINIMNIETLDIL